MKKIYTIAIALLVAATSFAQTGHRYSQVYSFNWQTSLPLGEQAEFIPSMGLNGANFNFGFFVTDNIAVGADFSWSYNQKSVSPDILSQDSAKIFTSGNNLVFTAFVSYDKLEKIGKKGLIS